MRCTASPEQRRQQRTRRDCATVPAALRSRRAPRCAALWSLNTGHTRAQPALWCATVARCGLGQHSTTSGCVGFGEKPAHGRASPSIQPPPSQAQYSSHQGARVRVYTYSRGASSAATLASYGERGELRRSLPPSASWGRRQDKMPGQVSLCHWLHASGLAAVPACYSGLASRGNARVTDRPLNGRFSAGHHLGADPPLTGARHRTTQVLRAASSPSKVAA
jgi:hypothetical protein